MEEIVISKKCLSDTPKGIMLVSGVVAIFYFIFFELLHLERDKRAIELLSDFGGVNVTLEEIKTLQSNQQIYEQAESIFKYDKSWNLLNNCGNVYLIVSIFCAVLFVVSVVLLVLISQSELKVTNKRLYGKNAFGQSINLPLDTISAVAASDFNTLIITAPSSKNYFVFLPDDYKNVSEEITNLILKSKASLSTEQMVKH